MSRPWLVFYGYIETEELKQKSDPDDYNNNKFVGTF